MARNCPQTGTSFTIRASSIFESCRFTAVCQGQFPPEPSQKRHGSEAAVFRTYIIYIYTHKYYNPLLHSSSQCCGTLHSLAFPTSGGELFFYNGRCYAYNDHCQKWSKVTFRINPRVIYPPQRTQLLSDVNVFGGLFLC